MLDILTGNDFWLSSTPLLLVGGLAAILVLAWDWRVALPALILVQVGIGALSVRRSSIPDDWSAVFGWVVVGCCLILLLSIRYAQTPARPGRIGTLFFRGLLLGLAGFLLQTRVIDLAALAEFLPLIDGQLSRLLIWLAFCALFATANAEGALENGLALLLWLIAAEAALLAVAPAAIVVVLVGALFLLVSLACSYLLIAENLALAEESRPLTDEAFPTDPVVPPVRFPAHWESLRRKVTALGSPAPGGKQP